MLVWVKRGLLILSFLLLCGCVFNQLRTLELRQQLINGASLDATLLQMQSYKVADRDLVQHQLNRGYLELLAGRFEDSISSFTVAKNQIKTLNALSLTETVGANTVNETARSYVGSSTDRVLLHGFLALAYLFSNDLSSARVEALQADVEIQQLQEKSASAGQLAFVRFVNGVVFELNQEWSDAHIAYFKAFEIMQERAVAAPNALLLSLLNAADRVGAEDTRQRVYADYPQVQSLFEERQKTQFFETARFFIFLDGHVSQMFSNHSHLWSVSEGVYVNVSLPAYPPKQYAPSTIGLSSAGTILDVGVVEDIDARVREDLERRSPGLIATALARGVVKYHAVKKVQEEGDLLGAFFNALTVATEVADTRSWTFLPSVIQIARAGGSDNIARLNGAGFIQEQITMQKKQVFLFSDFATDYHQVNF